MASLCALRVDCSRPIMETIEVEEYDCDGVNSGATTPSEDIWSKFEMGCAESLYPTPPLSPDNKGNVEIHEVNWQGTCRIDQFSRTMACFEDEQTSWLTEQSIDLSPLLDLEFEHFSKPVDSKNATNKAEEKPKELKKSLIQDCMWSAYKKLLQKDSESEKHNTNSNDSSIRSTCENIYNESSHPSDCVDPTAVFPYPLSITETHLDLNLAGTSTPSDSEEEIDVVTIATIDSDAIEEKKKVPKKENHHHKHKHRKVWEISCSTPEHDYAKPTYRAISSRTLKRSKSSLAHSQTKRRKLNGVNPDEVKKALEGLNTTKSRFCMFNPTSSRGSSKMSSQCSSNANSHSASDSEDCDKRVNHNVLERKRREDLRSAFFRLRDRIPELESKERASKVVILEKSRTYVLELREEHEDLAFEKEVLTRRHKELVARLRKLRTF